MKNTAHSMTISFIICTYNRDKYIYECLKRLVANTVQTDWEIILINNNSTDNTAAECERFVSNYKPANYHYFLETNQGLSFARNRGIAEAHGKWLVFLDDDAMVDVDYIANLKHHLCLHKEAGAFGGQIEPFFEEKEPDWLNPWAMSFVSAMDMGEQVKLFPTDKYPIGANMGISRETIEKIGTFNTSLGRIGNNLLGGEEKDMFLRIRNAGIPILYLTGIKVRHCIPHKRTTKEFIEKMGIGVGVSEKLRTQNIGSRAYYKRIFFEIIKWGGTIILWCYYMLRLQPAKGNILVTFRKSVTCGLFGN